MKNLKKILAAVVAIPVASSAVLSVPAFAVDSPIDDDAVVVGLDQILAVPGDQDTMPENAAELLEENGSFTFTQTSSWNDTLAKVMADVEDGKEVNVALTDLEGLFGESYYGELLTEILEYSGDATAVYDATAKVLTLSGLLDMSAYIQEKIDDKLASNPDYADLEFELDTTNIVMNYVFEIGCDFENGKTVSVTDSFTTETATYTLGTIGDYFDVLVEDLTAQIEDFAEATEADKIADAEAQLADAEAQLEDAKAQLNDLERQLTEAQLLSDTTDEEIAALEDKIAEMDAVIAEKQAEYDEKVIELNDTLAEADAEIASMIEELSEAISGIQNQVNSAVSLLDKMATFELSGTKSYDTLSEAYTVARNWALNNYSSIGNRLPASAEKAISQYADQIASVIDLIDNTLVESGANVVLDLSADDLTTLLNGAGEVDIWTSGAGVINIEFTFEDSESEQEDTIAYVESKLETEIEHVDFTEKKVQIELDMNTQSFTMDIFREVTVYDMEHAPEVEEPEPSETTEPSESGEPSETTEPSESGEPSETTEPSESGEPSETTEPSESGEPSETTEPSESGEPSETTEPSESGEPSETTEPIETTPGGDPVNPDPSETTEPIETTPGGDPVNPDTSETTEPIETTPGGTPVNPEPSEGGESGEGSEGGQSSEETPDPSLIPSVSDVLGVSVDLAYDADGYGMFYDTDDEFYVADLIAEVHVTLSDGTVLDYHHSETVIDFLGVTPGELYDSVDKTTNPDGKIYYMGTIACEYHDANGDVFPIDTEIKVAVGKRGDVNFDGEIDPNDATAIQVYYATMNLTNDATLTDGSVDGLEALAYYVADIDTMSKAGADTDKNFLDTNDAHYINVFYAQVQLGNLDITWDEALTM